MDAVAAAVEQRGSCGQDSASRASHPGNEVQSPFTVDDNFTGLT